MPRITQRTLGRLEPKEKPDFIRDDDLSGFGIKVNPTGKATYFAEARVKSGRTVRKTIGNVDHLSLDDAKNEARGLLLDLKRGIDVGKRKPPAPPEPNTLGELVERFLSERNLKASTRNQYEAVLRNCCGSLMEKDVAEITTEDVAAIYTAVTDRASKSYARIGLRTLRAVLNASDLTTNPVSHFLRRSGVSSVSEAKTRYLSGQEIERIIDIRRDPATNEANAFGQLLNFYLLTGCRKNEALNLTRDDYSPTHDTVTFRDTKNGRDHEIPCEGYIGTIIQDRLNEGHDRLWPISESTFRTKLDHARKYLRFDQPWSAHDLRRTFAELCQLIGVDQNVIAACLNHTPVGVTATSYLGGGLAKREMLRDVYRRLQRQYAWYHMGMPETRLPDGVGLDELLQPTE